MIKIFEPTLLCPSNGNKRYDSFTNVDFLFNDCLPDIVSENYIFGCALYTT